MASHRFVRTDPPDTEAQPATNALANQIAERALVARVRAGDHAAFRTLLVDYYPRLCGFVHSYLRDAAETEDVVQDLFCALWERRADWSPTDGVRPYLFGAARNRALGCLRHGRVVARTAALHPSDASLPPPGMGSAPATSEEQLRAAELAAACRRAIHALPERQRLAATMRWQHGMKHAEIARVLGISVKGVETQLGRAVKTLRTRLRGIWP